MSIIIIYRRRTYIIIVIITITIILIYWIKIRINTWIMMMIRTTRVSVLMVRTSRLNMLTIIFYSLIFATWRSSFLNTSLLLLLYFLFFINFGCQSSLILILTLILLLICFNWWIIIIIYRFRNRTISLFRIMLGRTIICIKLIYTIIYIFCIIFHWLRRNHIILIILQISLRNLLRSLNTIIGFYRLCFLLKSAKLPRNILLLWISYLRLIFTIILFLNTAIKRILLR